MSLREQIEAALADIDAITRNRVLDIIDQHECYDREALARALRSLSDAAFESDLAMEPGEYEPARVEWFYGRADAIIAALKEQNNAKD